MMPKLTLPSGEVLSEVDVERTLEILTRGIISCREVRGKEVTPEVAAWTAEKLLEQLTALERCS